ncbi:formate dehydrogenase subunit alpha [Methanobacterium movens]
MKKKIKFLMDGLEFEADEGTTILQSAIENDIYIPHLCYNSQLKPYGACRLCLVENAEGRLITSCENQVEEGMEIKTHSMKLNRVKKMLISLLISNHEKNCLSCTQSDNCKLQEAASYLQVNENELENLRQSVKDVPRDESNPFFIRDLKKCILCGICVQVCADIMGVNAIDFGFRGYDTRITTFGDKDILESNCVSCGECVEACPVGALVSRNSLTPAREVKTICPYCGVGCGIYLGIRGGEIVSVRGDPESMVNQGKLCVKGRFAYEFINHPQRLKKPLIKKQGKFEEVGWDEALKLIADKFSKYSGNEFASIASAKCTNEENYLLQKFTRGVMESPHIDHCARLCHAPSVVGLSRSIGSGAMSNSIAEIGQAGCIMAIGTNTTVSHPVLALQIIKAVKTGSKLIVINPQKIELAKHADIFLQHNPGSDVALLMAIAKVIVDEGLYNQSFIEERTENFLKLKKSLEILSWDELEHITGVEKEKIRQTAYMYAEGDPSSILYAMGITQHSHGTDNVLAVSNLALLTGNLGRESSGVNPLRGQNNVQGSCDMGTLPNVFPGYQSVEDPEIVEKFQKAWNMHLKPVNGMMLSEIFEKARSGDLKSLYIMGENPLLSEPDIQKVKMALENVEFLVVQDIFLTETARQADVVLPAASFAEKEGTFTNTERRVQRIKKAIIAPGDSKSDWEIISAIAKKMEKSGFDFKSAEEIFSEMTALTPIYGGISYDRLENQGLHWPCLDIDDPGTPILHQNQFNTPSHKGIFHPLEYIPSAEIPDEEYPFILGTGRSLYQYHTGSMTRKVNGLNYIDGEEFLEINPDDASNLNIKGGELLEISSRRGTIRARSRINPGLLSGCVSMTFHFQEAPANCLTQTARDPVSGTPELKISTVKIRVLSEDEIDI